MASIQTINIGNLANDGLGDDLRTAFEKVNSNFTELNDELTVDVVNLARSTSAGVFQSKNGSELRLRGLVSGEKITITENSETIEIASTVPDAFIRYDTDSGFIQASTNQQIYIQGAAAAESETGIKDIEVTTDGTNGLKIKTTVPVSEYLTTYDFGGIGNTYDNALQLAFQTANIDFATLTIDSDINLDCGTLT